MLSTTHPHRYTMDDLKVLTIGGSRNIGYYSSMRLLSRFVSCLDIYSLTRPTDSGATVTFLLRSSTAFANDQAIQTFVTSGKARLVQGDALVKEDVQRAWTEAGKGDDNRPVDLLVFTVGEYLGYNFCGLWILTVVTQVGHHTSNSHKDL